MGRSGEVTHGGSWECCGWGGPSKGKPRRVCQPPERELWEWSRFFKVEAAPKLPSISLEGAFSLPLFGSVPLTPSNCSAKLFLCNDRAVRSFSLQPTRVVPTRVRTEAFA